MRTFEQFMEDRSGGIFDPKRNPGIDDPGYLDDYDDEYSNRDYTRSQLGLTAQYPLAKTSGNPRGFQIKSPKELFSKSSAFADSGSKEELVNTLKAKLYAHEPMTRREIDFLSRHIDRDMRNLKNQGDTSKDKISDLLANLDKFRA